tara:strand:+ start:647 stop:1642 length:996 start_codon:yes stop_codon:yes gene_type:complete
MDKLFLKEVLSIPTISKEEDLMRDYIVAFAINNNISYKIDNKGNVYLTKGSEKMTQAEYYPCVVSHIDTVHFNQKELVENNERLVIFEKDDRLTAYHPTTGEETGIGGDDKCGVFICLSLLERLDVLKAAFFVEEEIGMLGSKEALPEFFENVGYAIQFDAPSANWITEVCSGVKILDEGFKKKVTPILKKGGYTNFSNDPFTDVNQLAQKFDFNCLNLGCGYYQQHSVKEYVIIEEVKKSLIVGINLIDYLGNKEYIHIKEPKKDLLLEMNYKDIPYESYTDHYDEYAEEIVDAVLKMDEKGYGSDEIKIEISELLYSKDILKYEYNETK